jgi:uroporphyrin-III C-methyltransferase
LVGQVAYLFVYRDSSFYNFVDTWGSVQGQPQPAGRLQGSQVGMRESLPDGTHAPAGRVYLVGAGPGDPGLLTLRAAEILRSADVVLVDQLVSPEVRRLCRSDATIVDVGKRGHGDQTSQRAIEERLVAEARAGHRVVRLKGGDPLLFGRGSEEALALRRAGVPYEIVPGVSSAMAAPAYAGIPLTARGIAGSVAIVAGHLACGNPAPIPRADTVVVLMGVANACAIRDQLLASGRSSSTPVAVIERGTWRDQRSVVGELDELGALIERHRIVPPALIVIGEVVRLHRELEWTASPVGPISNIQQ